MLFFTLGHAVLHLIISLKCELLSRVKCCENLTLLHVSVYVVFSAKQSIRGIFDVISSKPGSNIGVNPFRQDPRRITEIRLLGLLTTIDVKYNRVVLHHAY